MQFLQSNNAANWLARSNPKLLTPDSIILPED